MTDKIKKTVDIAEDRGKLSGLIDQAVKGEPFIISKEGEPLDKVSALGAPGPTKTRRLGFRRGRSSSRTISIRCIVRKSNRCSMVTSKSTVLSGCHTSYEF
jgi:antitoxin (DNA-binding transcriptional repressor) of toxin-antitoxin stability system